MVMAWALSIITMVTLLTVSRMQLTTEWTALFMLLQKRGKKKF